MKLTGTLSCASLLLFSTVVVHPAAAQTGATQQALTLHATGTFHGGGEFTGTVAINRFEARGDQVFAIGFVQGILRRGEQILGSAVMGEVALPVTVGSGGVIPARGRSAAAPQFRRISLTSSTPNGRVVPAQQTCTVAQITIGPHDFNLAGFHVTLDPVVLTLSGDSAEPLGALVCQALALLQNVAGLVAVLNNILALLIALLGGGLAL